MLVEYNDGWDEEARLGWELRELGGDGGEGYLIVGASVGVFFFVR